MNHQDRGSGEEAGYDAATALERIKRLLCDLGISATLDDSSVPGDVPLLHVSGAMVSVTRDHYRVTPVDDEGEPTGRSVYLGLHQRRATARLAAAHCRGYGTPLGVLPHATGKPHGVRRVNGAVRGEESAGWR